ncbi:envelope protein UL20 [Beluga whale alphaherpesvirus 1]|uniref:Envelope protein UL20 n=1 Tax=Beluga whale alphaherpesvirus 1 TaxID=1434720 RepID=A0A286MM61_9ALPH|nr:envelope protein UL20 [Beluga whale alphaherpesvirus 1]ASW27087.1 envelope protein UL20 [Beluga whale alphaherpesvirus 1]
MAPGYEKLREARDAEDAEDGDVLDRVSLASYGGDHDFLLSSGAARVGKGGRPAFTPHVLAFFASALLIKPACCVFFLGYYRHSGDAQFIFAGACATVAYYLRVGLMACFMYANIRADRLPLLPWQQLLLATLSVCRAAVFLITAYTAAFWDPRFFLAAVARRDSDHYIAPDQGWDPAHRSPLAVTLCLAVALAVYSADLLCDTLGFCVPRIWLAAGLRTRLSV